MAQISSLRGHTSILMEKSTVFRIPMGITPVTCSTSASPNKGIAKLKLTDNDVVLGDGSNSHSLFSNGGTALVIHADADDMKTDPSGNSGARIACGVVTK